MRTENTHLVWTDDEVQLLLQTKKDKRNAGVVWESIKNKYENFRGTFVSNLPKETGSEECAHSTDFFTRERIVSKIKQIRAKY